MSLLSTRESVTRAIVDRRVPEAVVPVVVIALVVWTLRALHQRACNTSEVALNTMLRLCYSDLPVVWRNGAGRGGSPYADPSFDQAPLVAAWVVVTQRLTLFVAPTADGGVLGRTTFFVGLNVLLLGGAFMVLVLCHLWISRRHPAPEVTTAMSARSSIGTSLSSSGMGRIGLWTATCLGVLTAGTISWSLVPAALLAVALVLWAGRRLVAAGIVLGLAASAAWYPLLVLVALCALCWRADRLRDWGRTAAATLGTWLLVNLVAVLLDPTGWMTQMKAALMAPIGLGTLWYVLQQARGQNPSIWVVSWVLVGLAAVAVVGLCVSAPRRPRVAQVVALLVLAVTITAPVFSPQHVLWIAPLVLLARPVKLDWFLFSLVEALYWAAVWGHLQGNLWAGGPIGIYALAVFARVFVEVFIVVRIVRDVLHPWSDPVRVNLVDDPLGGVLDHAADRAPDDDLDISRAAT